MKYLTEKEFLSRGWTPEVEHHHADVIKERIEANDQYTAWYKTLTPLKLYLRNTSLRVNAVAEVTGTVQFDTLVEDNPYRVYKEVVYLPTTKEFYGNYYQSGVEYCKATLFCNNDSNLDLWSIRLSGTDDYSISFDIVGEDEAQEKWGELFEGDVLTESMVEGYYFSN